MEDMRLTELRGISVTMGSNYNGNLMVAAAADRSSMFSAEEIVRVLGDPRDHVVVTSSQGHNLAGWLLKP